MEDKKIAIKVSTLDRLAEGFQESRGITDKLTIQQMIAFAKEPVGGGENKLNQFLTKTITEVTAKDLKGVTSIGQYAFEGCKKLIKITIPTAVTSFGTSAFNNCTKLENVYYTGNITQWCNIFHNNNQANPMNSGAYLYFRNSLGEYELVTDIVIPNITSIKKYTFHNCKSIVSATISNTVTSIESSAFGGCINLTNVKMGSNVKTIGDWAFYNTNITSIAIPSTTTKIDYSAFSGCANLTDIYIDKAEGSISSSPWGANNAQIHWNTPFPSEEA